ncbi:MAG: hypothetical protein RSF34_16175 [Flavobacterium sp.]|uniref:hypothetical protein n=1 Tax=Flavobacterium sp. TaxID=239 RepID=UPI002FC9548D
MHLKKVLAKASIFLFFFSCNTVNHKVIKNEKRTIKISNEIFMKNKNVFVLSYSFANFSYIFSYRNSNTVEWYKIVNGKISDFKQLETDHNFFLNKTDSLNSIDFWECDAFDHSYLKLKFYSDEKLVDDTYAIDPDCFVKSESRDDFLKNIKVDLENYKRIDNSIYH